MSKFIIIVTGYNCENFVKSCADSLLAQTYKNWNAIFINDGSTDKTSEEINKHCFFNQKFIIQSFKDNKGAAYRRHKAINTFCHNLDIIVFLGMDDTLNPNALERINKEYESGKWMTYGNWINQFGNGLPENFELDFPKHIHETRDYRKVTYRSTAPNTFRKFLYNCIKDEDLQATQRITHLNQVLEKGEWYPCCTEGEVMFSCLEQSGQEHIGIIKDKIYNYTESTAQESQNVHNGTLKRFGREFKYKIYDDIINKPKRNLYVF